jgi:hypothetical protein
MAYDTAIPDEAVSIICAIVDKTVLLISWGKLMYVSYTTDRQVFQWGIPQVL